MAAFNTLHNELRLRIPNKPYELYDDVIRWAIDTICRKTSLWRITTTVTTQAVQDIYPVVIPTDSVIHSTLYAIQKGNTDRVVKRPANGLIGSAGYADSDYLKTFRTYSKNEVQLIPKPKQGEVTVDIITAIKPTTNATSADNDKFFDEYKDVVIYGALYRLYQIESDLEQAEYNNDKFKEGCSSIHTDVLKENADTPMRLSSSW